MTAKFTTYQHLSKSIWDFEVLKVENWYLDIKLKNELNLS
jgi:hypothetical protein